MILVEDIIIGGSHAMPTRADVDYETGVSDAFDTIEHEFVCVDVVVHAAGIMLLSPLAELNLAHFDLMHRANIRGTFLVNQQAAGRVAHTQVT